MKSKSNWVFSLELLCFHAPSQKAFNFPGVAPAKIVNDLFPPILRSICCGDWALELRRFHSRSAPSSCLECPVSSSCQGRAWRGGGGAAGPVTIEWVASTVASLTCQGRQAVSPHLTYFPSSSWQAPGGSSPSWLIHFPWSDVSGEARMFSDVGGGDRFSDFNVSCRSFQFWKNYHKEQSSMEKFGHPKHVPQTRYMSWLTCSTLI